MATILVADDESKMRRILGITLNEDDHEVLEAKDAAEAIQCLNQTTPSIIISDLRMPGGGGLAVLDAVRERRLSIPVIILTAYGTIENAVEAMHHGAHDYLLKPCDLDELKLKVNKALQVQHLERVNVYLREELNEYYSGKIVAESEPMRELMQRLPKVAQAHHPILIQGESGTGKELLARTIHNMSHTGDSPFVAVKCAGVPADLLDLDLFGQVRGPGTGAVTPREGKAELANGGVLFLDGIGDVSMRLQGKLLRLIDEGTIEPVGSVHTKKVKTRLIVSTERNVQELVEKKQFRDDLFYRLNVTPLHLPPLRERRKDIKPLMDYFFKTRSKGKTPFQFTEDQWQKLFDYAWPGNVRELIQFVERALVLQTTDLNQLLPTQPEEVLHFFNDNYKELLQLSYKEAKKTILDQFEHLYFTHLLQKFHGNISRASELSQMHRKNFHVKLTELGIDPHDFSS